jgi:hypothetical protein
LERTFLAWLRTSLSFASIVRIPFPGSPELSVSDCAFVGDSRYAAVPLEHRNILESPRSPKHVSVTARWETSGKWTCHMRCKCIW